MERLEWLDINALYRVFFLGLSLSALSSIFRLGTDL